MPFKLIDLPYGKEALAPVISAETLDYHHGKHHAGYIKKVNAAIEGTPMDDVALEQVISAARGSDQGLFNNAAQSWNHGFYWHSLAADAAGAAGISPRAGSGWPNRAARCASKKRMTGIRWLTAP